MNFRGGLGGFVPAPPESPALPDPRRYWERLDPIVEWRPMRDPRLVDVELCHIVDPRNAAIVIEGRWRGRGDPVYREVITAERCAQMSAEQLVRFLHEVQLQVAEAVAAHFFVVGVDPATPCNELTATEVRTRLSEEAQRRRELEESQLYALMNQPVCTSMAITNHHAPRWVPPPPVIPLGGFPEHTIEPAAMEKSLQLLEQWLSPEQYAQWEAEGAFEVTGAQTGCRYRINRGTTHNIEALIPGTTTVGVRLCFGAPWLPLGDHLLAQKIALETDEAAALHVANMNAMQLTPQAVELFSRLAATGRKPEMALRATGEFRTPDVVLPNGAEPERQSMWRYIREAVFG